MEPYASFRDDRNLRLPATDLIASRIVVLPTGTAVTEADIDTIGSIIRVAVAGARELARRQDPLAARSAAGSGHDPETYAGMLGGG